MTDDARRPDAGFDLVNVLGQRLRERRRELGLTLAEVAAAADISVGHSSAIEKGNTLPSLSVLARLAHALQLTLAEVLRASPGPRIAHGRIASTPGTSELAAAGRESRSSTRGSRPVEWRSAVSPRGRRRLRVRPRRSDRDPRERRPPRPGDRGLGPLPRARARSPGARPRRRCRARWVTRAPGPRERLARAGHGP